MWEIVDYIIADFIEVGDVIKLDDLIIHVEHIDVSEDDPIVIGYEDEWGEDIRIPIDSTKIIPIVMMKD